MRVLVTGGRNYHDIERVYQVLDRLHQQRYITQLINGGSTGADLIASDWVHLAWPDIELLVFPADWKKHGKAAGPIRNQQMIELKPDLVVAFPGGRGTADMVQRARAAGIEVMEVAGSDVG